MYYSFLLVSATAIVLYYFGLGSLSEVHQDTEKMSLPSAIRIVSKTPKLAIIFLHGLGDSGQGWSWFPQIVKQLNILTTQEADSINYVFPNAPEIPITVNNGFSMPAWFDIFAFGDPNAKQDIPGILKLADILKKFVQEQIDTYNIPPEKIIIGGFSQGAAVTKTALHVLDLKVGGAIILSGFLPIRKESKEHLKSTNLETPIFQGHGTVDPVIAFEIGKADGQLMKDSGFKNHLFKAYPGLAHSAGEEELMDVQNFIKKIIQ